MRRWSGTGSGRRRDADRRCATERRRGAARRYGGRPRRGSATPRVFAAAAALLALLVTAVPGGAQLQISGQVEVLAKHGSDDRGLNGNFHGDSPFSPVRARLFAQRWLTDRIGVFAEFLYDIEADPRVNGAYLVINEIGGVDWLSARAGLAPSLVGSFGLRSTYFNSNPLIGVPLIWQHRTTLDGSGLSTAADVLRRRASNTTLLPMLYDACWNVQWELMGSTGRFEYSLGVTNAAMSNPAAKYADGVQVLGRVGVEPVPGLRVGLSGGRGPYIGGPNRDALTPATSYPGDPDDYAQTLLGWDAEYAMWKLHFLSEGFVSTWEAPLVAEDLTARSAYVEGRYDFLPSWFAALRVGAMTFSDIDGGPGVGETGWDDDVVRIESSLTYRVAREVHLRGGWQHTRFTTGPEEPIDLVAIQLRAVF